MHRHKQYEITLLNQPVVPLGDRAACHLPNALPEDACLPLAIWNAQRGQCVPHANHTGMVAWTNNENEEHSDSLLTRPLTAIGISSIHEGRRYTASFRLRSRVMRKNKGRQDTHKRLTGYRIRHQMAGNTPALLLRKRAMEMADFNDEPWEP